MKILKNLIMACSLITLPLSSFTVDQKDSSEKPVSHKKDAEHPKKHREKKAPRKKRCCKKNKCEPKKASNH